MGVKNEQTAGFASLVSQRQDRGSRLADGGDFLWEAFYVEIGGPNLTVTGASSFHVGSGSLTGNDVRPGDTLRVLAGPNAGTYRVATVAGATDGTIEETFGTTPDGVGRLYQIGAGRLSWSGIISLFVPGLGKHTLAAGEVLHVQDAYGANPPHGVFVDVDRDGPAALTATARELDDADWLAEDTRLLIAVRGEDGRLYLSDGTTLTDGEERALGTLGSSTINRDSAVGDGATATFTLAFEYLVGQKQLYVTLGGIGMVEGVDYNETSSTTVQFTTAPGVGEDIEFINLAGAQGPSGPPGGQTLQEAYDAGGEGDGREVEISDSSGPLSLYDDDDSGAVELLRAGKNGTRDLLQILSDGSLLLQKISISDGIGGYFTLQGSAGNLVVEHSVTEQALVLDKDGGIYFTDAGVRPTGADASAVRVAVYAGTLDADGTTTVVSTGLTTIKSVLAMVADQVGDMWAAAMNLSADSNRRLVVTYDAATGVVTLSGASDKTTDPGAYFTDYTNDYTLLVFY